MKKNKLGIIICSLSVLMSACARDIQSNVYSASSVGEASFTYQGVILSARQVSVQGSENLEGNTTGIGLGAVAGGLAGNQFGAGSGNVATTVGGAVLGGVLGSLLEKKLKTQNGMEYAVKLTNGQLMTVVQGMDAVYSVGQKVLVMVSNDGRSRVVPDNSGVQDVQAPMPAPQVNIKKNR